jgi:hypothetical protein
MGSILVLTGISIFGQIELHFSFVSSNSILKTARSFPFDFQEKILNEKFKKKTEKKSKTFQKKIKKVQ